MITPLKSSFIDIRSFNWVLRCRLGFNRYCKPRRTNTITRLLFSFLRVLSSETLWGISPSNSPTYPSQYQVKYDTPSPKPFCLWFHRECSRYHVVESLVRLSGLKGLWRCWGHHLRGTISISNQVWNMREGRKGKRGLNLTAVLPAKWPRTDDKPLSASYILT